jgi:hypothetical protein
MISPLFAGILITPLTIFVIFKPFSNVKIFFGGLIQSATQKPAIIRTVFFPEIYA